MLAGVTEDTAEAELKWGAQIVMLSSGLAAVELLACLWAAQVQDRLQDISQPTLLIHGRRDLITLVAESGAAARRAPNAKLVVMDDAGHEPVVTRPDQVTEAVTRFFG